MTAQLLPGTYPTIRFETGGNGRATVTLPPVTAGMTILAIDVAAAPVGIAGGLIRIAWNPGSDPVVAPDYYGDCGNLPIWITVASIATASTMAFLGPPDVTWNVFRLPSSALFDGLPDQLGPETL